MFHYLIEVSHVRAHVISERLELFCFFFELSAEGFYSRAEVNASAQFLDRLCIARVENGVRVR